MDQGDHQTQGLEIGLWLSRELIEMQGGTVTADSEGQGTGAEYCIKLHLSARKTHHAEQKPNGRMG